MTHVYLIRHAEAVSNVEPVVAGMRGDRGLTPLGVAQAERLRDRLVASGELAADVVLASTLPRARQTAEIIAPALGQPIVWDDDLQEIRPGEADGLSLDELRERYGSPDYEMHPQRPISPGGESWVGFLARIDVTFQRILGEHEGQRIVIVSHGGVVDGSFHVLGRMNLLSPQRVDFDTRNTAITHWQWHQQTERPPRWRLMRYNDAVHLDAATWLERPAEETHPSVPLPTEE